MEVIKKIKTDFSVYKSPPIVDVMQNDRNTRKIQLEITADGEKWIIPDDVSVLLGYTKPNGEKRTYNKLSNGQNAGEYAENVVKVTIIPEALNISGVLNACIILKDSSLNQIATFPFKIRVNKNPATSFETNPEKIGLSIEHWYEIKEEEHWRP